MSKFFWIVLMAAMPILALAEAPAQQQARIDRLEKSVLAPCCYTQPVGQHQSEIAVKMRLEIAKWVRQGRSDQEILDTYARQYGAKVLVDPNTIPKGWTFLVPWAVAIFGAMGAGWLVLRWHGRTTALAATGASSAELPDVPGLDD